MSLCTAEEETDGWYHNVGNKYKVVQQLGISHEDAVRDCSALNAILVTINERTELDFLNIILAGFTGSLIIGILVTVLASASLIKYTVYLNSIFWYTTTGSAENDTTKWVSGESVPEYFWCANQPTSTNLPMVLDTSGGCYKTLNAGADGYICEIEKGKMCWHKYLPLNVPFLD